MGAGIKAAVSTRDKQDKLKISVSHMMDQAYYPCNRNLVDAMSSLLHMLNHVISGQTYRAKSTESLTQTISSKTGNVLGHTFRQGFIHSSENMSISPSLCSPATILTPGPSSLPLPNPQNVAYSCESRYIFLVQSTVGETQFQQSPTICYPNLPESVL